MNSSTGVSVNPPVDPPAQSPPRHGFRGKRARLIIAVAAAGILAALAFTSTALAASGDITITGRGYGHAEGMSQWGAWVAAREGVKYDAILAFYYPGATLSTLSPGQMTKVRLTRSSNSSWCYYRVDLHPTVTSATLVMHDATGDHTQTVAAGTIIKTLYSGGKVQVTGTAGVFDWVELRPESTDGRVALSLWAASTTPTAYTIEYWGTLRVQPDTDAASLRLYDILLLERYLRSIAEVDPGWANSSLPDQYAPESVKAQAIAARTYAIAHSTTTDMYDNTNDQMYMGYTWEATHLGIAAAADATAGQVLTYGGKPISAYFSTHSGGYLSDSAWSDSAGIPYLVAKADPWSLEAPVPPWTMAGPGYPWTVTISASSLASYLGTSVGTITKVEVLTRDTSDPASHARTLRITGTTGSTTMAARTFKSKLSGTEFALKSTLILSIVTNNSTTRFEQTDARIAYTPSSAWAPFSMSSASNGSYARSSAGGSYVTINFNGTYLAWIATVGTTLSKADVSLDGAAPVTIDLARSAVAYQQNVWDTGTLAPGVHTVKISRNASDAAGKFISLDAVDVSGTLLSQVVPSITSLSVKNGATSGGTSVVINGADFTGTTAVTFGGVAATSFAVDSATRITAIAPAHAMASVRVQVTTPVGSSADTAADDYAYTTRFEQSDTHIAYTPSSAWAPFSTGGASAGSYARSSAGGSYVTISFNGTYLAWIATVGTTLSKADVSLDGAAPVTIDLARSAVAYQQNVWRTGTLALGTHTVKISRNTTDAAGKFISLDAVEVQGSLN